MAIRNHSTISILFIDLDGFKAINDIGHDAGDEALKKVADIIRNSIRKNDTAGRIGGDEFVLCFYNISSKDSAQAIAENILKKIQNLNTINGHKITLGASIGGVFTHKPINTEIPEMIKIADDLMYQVKRSGKGKCFLNEL